MSEAKNVLRVVATIALVLIVLVVVVPVLLKIVGITLGILIHLAIGVIYLAVALAIGYLALVGIRALLR